MLTQKDIRFLQNLKAKGYSKDEATAALNEVKSRQGGGSQQEGQSSGFLGKAADVVGGALKSATVGPYETAKQLGTGAAEFVGNVAGGVIGKPIEAIGEKTGSQFLEKFGQNIQSAPSEILGEAKTPEEQMTRSIGKGIMTVGALGLNPITGGLRSAGAAGAAKLGAGKALQGVAGGLAASVPETIIASEGLEGRLPTKGEVGIGLALDTLLPFASKAIDAGSSVFKKAADLYKSGGIKYSPMTASVIKKVSDGTPEIKKSFVQMTEDYGKYLEDEAHLKSPMAQVGDDIYNNFTSTIVPEKQATGKAIGDYVAQFSKQETGNAIDALPIQKSFDDALGGLNVKVVEDAGTGAKSLDFADSSIRFSDSTQKELTRVFDAVQNAGNTMTRGDAWNLYRSIDDLLGGFSPTATQITKGGETPLISLKDTLKKEFISGAPEELTKLYSKYSELSDVVSALNRRLGSAGEGDYAVTKSIFGEGKYGQDVKNALQIMKKYTGIDYQELARMAKAAGEMAGDPQVESLLNLTSKKGIVDTLASELLTNKNKVIEDIKSQLTKEKVKVSQSTVEKVLNAALKALNIKLDSE